MNIKSAFLGFLIYLFIICLYSR